MKKIGVLIVNLGTPDSTASSDIRKYLRQFLLDKRVIDIARWQRELLVRCIITPFRASKSGASYKEIWDVKTGSPLKHYSLLACQKLQETLGANFIVKLAMRYQNPSIENALKQVMDQGCEELIVLPMFPHYASATTGSVHEEVMRVLSRWQTIPSTKWITDYYNHPLFIDSIMARAMEFNVNDYDHILFSYHGLPQRQIKKADRSKRHCLQKKDCCETLCAENRFCYSAQCYETSRLLNERLKLSKEKSTTCFQSGLGNDPWLQPFIINVLEELANKGVKKVLAFSPAFTADCLETIYEIAIDYNNYFKKMGGEKIQLVPSLNDSDTWISCMASLIRA